MSDSHKHIKDQLSELVNELIESKLLKSNHLFVVGCSTSEIIKKHIGTAGSEEIAGLIFEELKRLQSETGVQLAFQSCEHINRALVIEREVMIQRGYEQVAVIPVRKAGGSMAAYAFKQLKDPVVVETIKADAGIDIGDTLIGMHLRRVAVPLRLKVREIGGAHVNAAKTRPKLIGGERAVYQEPEVEAKLCD